jgi:alpha-glucosidase
MPAKLLWASTNTKGAARDAWPNWVIGNHDRPRVATRYGKAQARVAAVCY